MAPAHGNKVYEKNSWVYVEETVVVPAHIDLLNFRVGIFNNESSTVNARFDELKIEKVNELKAVQIIEENNYYPFGLEHKGYNNQVNGQENNFQTYQGQEIHKELDLNAIEFKYRFYYPALGRFWSVDPLADGYTYQSPYNFAENSVVANFELEGLEAKLAIHGEGAIGQTAYTQSDINSFHARASSLEKNHGYSAEGVKNGQQLLSSLKTATAEEGSVESAVIYAHGGSQGVFLDPSDGFYSSEGFSGANSASVGDLKASIDNGSIVFENDATIVFGSCNSCNQDSGASLAETITNETGVTTIGATGQVAPEIVNGKETGKLTTDGTFIKSDKVFDVTVSNSDGSSVTVTYGSESTANHFASYFDRSQGTCANVSSRIVQTDLGNTIDPSKL